MTRFDLLALMITANADGTTTFAVDMDTNDEFYAMFADIWPKALAILKEVCERA